MRAMRKKKEMALLYLEEELRHRDEKNRKKMENDQIGLIHNKKQEAIFESNKKRYDSNLDTIIKK